MHVKNEQLIVVGGGLAGSEAAWQAAERGVDVILYEMRPTQATPVHISGKLAELVCSNSLGAASIDRALGLLKEEMRRMGSLIVSCAEIAAVPAGGALAVDREMFAETVTNCLAQHPKVDLRRQEVTQIPDAPVIIASGPLTSEALAREVAVLAGEDHLHFFDAMAPIVEAQSIDTQVAFGANRYGRGEKEEGDYINCPLSEDEYYRFVEALLSAETKPLREFERDDKRFFEACLPVEVLAARGHSALAFGPLRPVGLTDPRTGNRPYAVVQLRQDNQAATLYNMVGFQTNLSWNEQDRVFRLIPGLEQAEFVRYGQMHRNTFVRSPVLLDDTLLVRRPRPGSSAPCWMAGQITGTEGYVGSAMGGLVAGLNAVCFFRSLPPLSIAPTTMTGALLHYVSHADPQGFQPMKANFGLLPALQQPVRRKRERYQAYAHRALDDLDPTLERLASL